MSKLTTVSLLCISVAVASPAAAQSAVAPSSTTPAVAATPPIETLTTRPGSHVSGWYLAPTSGFTSMVGSRGYIFGMRGGLMLDQKFGIGLAGNVVGTDRTRVENDEVHEIGAYGGLYLQYVLASNRLVHGYLDTTIGSGGWCEQSADDECKTQNFAFIEPTVNLELNLAKHVKLATGVGYRFAIADKSAGHSSQDFSGFVARTSVVFGAF